jgi:alpha-tubulin suppressor-like RCC1 family protein
MAGNSQQTRIAADYPLYGAWKLDNDRKASLYDRAGHFRRGNEYDKAAAIYENILTEDSTDSEVYWSLVLCKYGVEYVEDPVTRRRIPTCNRTQYTSILADENYKQALERSDGIARSMYEEEARAIDIIQKGILEISSKEDPFDVFICYKETGEDGQRTKDSALAFDIYHQLVKEGYKVFFSRITLEKMLGYQYEPYIFAALNSAKVMLVVGTKPEHFNAVWVKNEWSRYLSLAKDDKGKLLIPCYRDMDAPAYIGKLCAELEIKEEGLNNHHFSIDNNQLYIKALRFSNSYNRDQLLEYSNVINDRISKRKQRTSLYDRCISMSTVHIVGLKSNGTVVAAGRNDMGQCNTSDWCDIVAVSANFYHTVGLRSDGTVVAIGSSKELSFMDGKERHCSRLEVQHWRDVISILAGFEYTIGVKSDGTVITTDDNECSTSNWNDIISVHDYHGYRHNLIGLKSDGTVVAIGDNNHGACDVELFSNITNISVGFRHTVGLRSNGTVIAVGENKEGQCNTNNWKDIIAISAGEQHTVGLKSDGTVVAVGMNEFGQCNVRDWRNIISISTGCYHTVGIKIDGTVVAVGKNDDGQRNVYDWHDIIAVYANSHDTIGLKLDGTAIAIGEHKFSEIGMNNWRDIVPTDRFVDRAKVIERSKADEEQYRREQEERVRYEERRIEEQHRYEEEQRRREEKEKQNEVERQQRKEQERIMFEERSKRWVTQGLCSNCGGQIGGLFSKKCKSCGKSS